MERLGKSANCLLGVFYQRELAGRICHSDRSSYSRIKMGDMFQRHIEDLTGIPLVTVTHLMNISAVLLLPINVIMDKIPFFNKRSDTKALKKNRRILRKFCDGLYYRFGARVSCSLWRIWFVKFSDSNCDGDGFIPNDFKMFMQSLSPLADAMSEMMKKRFKDREVYIGLDWPVLAGRSEIWVTAILLVPVFIGYAIILPGNAVLPLAGIINYSIAVGGLLLTGGNLVRMLIMGVISMPIYLYAATYLTPILTGLADKTGAVEGIKKANRLLGHRLKDQNSVFYLQRPLKAIF